MPSVGPSCPTLDLAVTYQKESWTLVPSTIWLEIKWYLERIRNKLWSWGLHVTREFQTKTFGLCLFFFLYCVPLSFIVFCYFFIVRTIFEHEKTLRDQAKKMNVTSLRSNADANATSAEIRIAKVALCNIALWAGMWTPYAAIVLKVFHQNDAESPWVNL